MDRDTVETTAGETSLFERIGGATTVDRLVEAFYARIEAFPDAGTIRAMHRPDLARTKDILKRYLTEWTGGPPVYSVERGHPRLRRRHLRFSIGEAERDAWLACMTGALEETVADAEARRQILSDVTSLADWMRNQPGNPHDLGEAHASNCRTTLVQITEI
jgi:hemoglobin